MQRNKPDKEWMLGLLGVMDPNNDVFKKGYKPPPKTFSNAVHMQQQNLPIREDFFDGLDVLSAREMRQKSSISFMSKK